MVSGNKLELIFFHNRPNRYSFNALAAALERQPDLLELPAVFARDTEELLDAVRRAAVPVVAVSFFSTQLAEMRRLLPALREAAANRGVVITGGPHPSGDPFGTLLLGADIVVIGEAENTFPELLRALAEDAPYNRIPGLAFLDSGGKMVSTGRASAVDLDAFSPVSVRYHKYGPIEISRGCPFVCAYCQTPHLFGGRMRHRSIPVILEAVEAMKRVGLWNFRAITPNAFAYGSHDGRSVNLDILEELLDSLNAALRPRGKIYFGTFPSEVRPEHVTPETVRLIRKYADNDNLILGAQTGSPRLLKACHRGHSVEDVLRAVEIVRSAGLEANVDFIFGLPGETEEDVQLTFDLMEQLVALGARIHAHSFLPLPQTPFGHFRPRPDVSELGRRMARRFPGAVYGNWLKQSRIALEVWEHLERTRRLLAENSKRQSAVPQQR